MQADSQKLQDAQAEIRRLKKVHAAQLKAAREAIAALEAQLGEDGDDE
jgi:hypothetical protein